MRIVALVALFLAPLAVVARLKGEQNVNAVIDEEDSMSLDDNLDSKVLDDNERDLQWRKKARKTIEQWLINNPNTMTLVNLAVAAEIAPNGPLETADALTLFAPLNKAFNDLFELYPGIDAFLTAPENRDALVSVLTYHVLAGKVLSGDIAKGKTEVEMLNEDTLIVKKSCRRFRKRRCTITLIDGSPDLTRVTRKNRRVKNGTVHLIDKVLIPPSLADTVATLRAPGH